MPKEKTPRLSTLLKNQLQAICVKQTVEYQKKDTKKKLVKLLAAHFGGQTLPPGYEIPGLDTAGLSFLQLRFVDEFIALGMTNATQAVINAGYKFSDRQGARSQAYKLKQNPKIRALITSRWEDVSMAADEAMALTAQLARGNMAEIIKIDDEGNIAIRADAIEDWGHLIKSIVSKKTIFTYKDNEEKETEFITVVLHDKLTALRMIMQSQEAIPGDGPTVNVNLGMPGAAIYSDRDLLLMTRSILEGNQGDEPNK